MNRKHLYMPVAAVLMAACGVSSNSRPPGFYVTISNLRFSPTNLAVPPGGTVTVINEDPMAHSVTSEAAVGRFTPGAVSGVSFNTGAFTGEMTFTLPNGAADGTVVPYYCTVHLGTMNTPNATITVSTIARPGPAPGGGMPGRY